MLPKGMTTNHQNDPIYQSLTKLREWTEQNRWKAYDPFDGLSSPYARYFTLNRPLLKQVWQQSVRRFPVNLRPFLRVKPSGSTKAMGFFAQGYLRLLETYGDQEYLGKTKYCLQWLIENRSPGYKGYCWGNHFDYQARGGNIPYGRPTIVWTGLIAHSFLDAYESIGDIAYLDVALSACEFIVNELGWDEQRKGICLRYIPDNPSDVHNSNMIGASLLARVNSLRPNPQYLELAERAVAFTAAHQTSEGGWYYGVAKKFRWIDSFHTGYVLEALDIFCRCTGNQEHLDALQRGYDYFVNTFFGSDGTPRYYNYKARPIDIQCASQGIQTLVHLRRLHPESIQLANKVALWTIAHMQDSEGYFYFRKYPLITNKTPTLHWGQATMFGALALLDQFVKTSAQDPAADPIPKTASGVPIR